MIFRDPQKPPLVIEQNIIDFTGIPVYKLKIEVNNSCKSGSRFYIAGKYLIQVTKNEVVISINPSFRHSNTQGTELRRTSLTEFFSFFDHYNLTVEEYIKLITE